MRFMNTAVQAVSYVQYTLDDYIDGIPKPIDDVISERFTQDKRIKSEPQLALFNNDHLGELHPVCPRCGSRKHIRYGFYERCPKIGDFGKITLHVQKYRCKRCGKRFSARIDGIVTKWRQYAEIFKERVNAIAAIMKHSGRKIREVLLALFGVAPSHQTIEDWLFAEMPAFSYSGFYTYDEQVVKVKGKKAFRLTLFDAVLNIPVAEEISYKLSAKTVEKFLEENVKGLHVYSITTDDRKWYREIIKGLKAIHQLCGFHFIKRVTKDAEYYFKRKSLSDAEKIRIAVLVSAIREVFRSVTEKEFLEKLEKVYAMRDTAPSLIKTHIDTLVEDVDLYTNYLLCPWIPKTSNHVEEYYRQTDPRKMKKRYKTIPGLTRALQLKAIYWIVKHGLILEDESLRLSTAIHKQTLQQNQYLHSIFSKENARSHPLVT